MNQKKTDILKMARDEMRNGGICTVKWVDDTGPEDVHHMRMYMATESHIVALYHATTSSGKQMLTIAEYAFSRKKDGQTIWYVDKPGQERYGFSQIYKNDRLMTADTDIDYTLLKRKIDLFEKTFSGSDKPPIILSSGAHSDPVTEFYKQHTDQASNYRLPKFVMNNFRNNNVKGFAGSSIKEDRTISQTFLRQDNGRIIHIHRVRDNQNPTLLDSMTIREHDPVTGYRDGTECMYRSQRKPGYKGQIYNDILTPRFMQGPQAFPPDPQGERRIFNQGILKSHACGVDYQFAEQAFRLEREWQQSQTFDQTMENFRNATPSAVHPVGKQVQPAHRKELNI